VKTANILGEKAENYMNTQEAIDYIIINLSPGLFSAIKKDT